MSRQPRLRQPRLQHTTQVSINSTVAQIRRPTLQCKHLDLEVGSAEFVMWLKAGMMRMVLMVPSGAKSAYHTHGADMVGLPVGLSP